VLVPLTLLLILATVVPPLSPMHVVHPFQTVGRYAAGDRGTDLAGVPGQTVVSATAGTVRFAGPVAGLGVVSVDLGDGRRLTYEPIAPAVRNGEEVAAGQPLGRLTVGRPDCPAPACLHWGLASGTGSTLGYADPMTLLGPTAVRLLPLAGAPDPAVGPPASAPTPAGALAREETTAPAPKAATAAATRSPSGAAVGTASAVVVGAGMAAVGVRRRRGRSSHPPAGP
jgi:hypothetical protein